MIIEVKSELLELIKTLEDREREDRELPDLNFAWSYYEDGRGATGESWAYNPTAEYQLYVSSSGMPTVQIRELGKYDSEGWETDPLDSDYEEEFDIEEEK